MRSDRAFCELLDYNLLFRWFLHMSLDDQGLEQSNFSRLRERLEQTDIARTFFDWVLRPAHAHQLLSAEHFTVDFKGERRTNWACLENPDLNRGRLRGLLEHRFELVGRPVPDARV